MSTEVVLMGDELRDHDSTEARLHAEVERLRAKLEELRDAKKRSARFRARLAGHLAGLAVRILAGKDLNTSARRWLAAKSASTPFPVNETGDLIAAVIRRTIWIGLLGVALALVPSTISIWQAAELRAQNSLARAQHRSFVRDSEFNQREALLERRGSALEVLYARTCDEAGLPECEPTFSLGRRGEAAWSLFDAERTLLVLFPDQYPELPPHPHLDLNNLDLARQDLSNAQLRSANLEGAFLSDTNLQGADLRFANLKGASLEGADLLDANLCGASLLGARLARYDSALLLWSEQARISPEQLACARDVSDDQIDQLSGGVP